jgi:multiple sugar transport system substrate-binding protein
MVAEFNRTSQSVVLQNREVKASNYYPKLAGAIKNGTAPDVVIANQSKLIDLVTDNALLPLDDYIKKAGIDLSDYDAGPIADCRIKGKLYAIPFDVHPLIMYYNKDLFTKAGIAKIPETLAELQETASLVQAKTGAIGIASDNTSSTYKAYTLARLFMSFLKEQGVNTLDARNMKANFNNSAGIKAYQAIYDMVNIWKVTPKGLDYDFSVKYFKEGNAAIHFNGVWATGLFEEQKGLNFGAVELPPFFGKSAAWAGSHTFAIPRTAKPDEAKILQILSCIDWFTQHGELWAKAGNIPTRKSVRQKPDFLALPHRAEYAAAAEDAFAAPMTMKWSSCYIAISDELELSISRNLDAKTALDSMERKVNAILKAPLKTSAP